MNSFERVFNTGIFIVIYFLNLFVTSTILTVNYLISESIDIYIWLFVLIVTGFSAATLLQFSQNTELYDPTKKLQKTDFIWIVGVTGLLFLIQIIFGKIFPEQFQVVHLTAVFTAYPLTIPAFVMFLTFGICYPLCEELVFRGAFLQILFKDHYLLGSLISSSVFSLVHAPINLAVFFYYFLMGILFAAGFQGTKKVQVPIITHILANLLIILN